MPGYRGKDGVVIGSMTNDRILIIPTKFWTSIKGFLVEAYGVSVNVVLNRFARDVGASYGEMMKEKGLTPEESFKLLQRMAEVAGWGRVNFIGDLRGGSLLGIDVTNCAFCPVNSPARGGSCDFLAGVAEGLAKTMYGIEFASGHADVTTTSERNCRITLSRADKAESDWKTAVHFPWMLPQKNPT